MCQLVNYCAKMVGVGTFEKCISTVPMCPIPGAHWDERWGELGLYVSKGQQKQTGR